MESSTALLERRRKSACRQRIGSGVSGGNQMVFTLKGSRREAKLRCESGGRRKLAHGLSRSRLGLSDRVRGGSPSACPEKTRQVVLETNSRASWRSPVSVQSV